MRNTTIYIGDIMKLKQLFIAPAVILTLLSATQNSWAENYHQFEVAGNYTDMNSDGGMETSGYAGGALAYLNPVSTKNYPYAESQFLSREPYVAAILGHIDMKLLSEDIGGNVYMLGGGYFSQNFPIFAEIMYGKSDLDGEINSNKLDYSVVTKQVNIGVYFNKLTAAKISYNKSNYEVSSASNSEEGDTDQYQLFFKKIVKASKSSFFNVEAIAGYEKDSDGDVDRQLGLLTDYYPNQSLGFGFGVRVIKGDSESSEGKDIVLRAKKFITPSFSIGLTFDKFLADNGDSDSQNVQIDGEFRF